MYYKKFHEMSIFRKVIHALVPLASCKDGFSYFKSFLYIELGCQKTRPTDS
jgi:hypothetical protein